MITENTPRRFPMEGNHIVDLSGEWAAPVPVAGYLSSYVIDLLAEVHKRLSKHGFGESLVILVPPKQAPNHGVRDDGRVCNFVVSGMLAEQLLSSTRISAQNSCYAFLAAALDSGSTSIDIVSGRYASPRAINPHAIDVIIPHRGSSALLHTSLSSIFRQTHPCRIIICFDDDPDPDFIWRKPHENVNFYRIRPNPAGPYVIRQHFLMNSRSQYTVFQDSDDFSVDFRIEKLITAAVNSSSDIVGSHELRIDELAEEVRAIRFPLDVTAALQRRASHPQLFPTTLVRTAHLQNLGGFSSHRTFGSDTEYLLRAHFRSKISNIDEFLYIRRRRQGSLTTAAKTSLKHHTRLRLDKRWKEDFEAIKAGTLMLEQSALRLQKTRQAYWLTDLATTAVERANLTKISPYHKVR